MKGNMSYMDTFSWIFRRPLHTGFTVYANQTKCPMVVNLIDEEVVIY